MGRLELPWDTRNRSSPGPLISVLIANSTDVLNAGMELGLEYPSPVTMKALIDTGAAMTVVSRTYARNRKLLLTNSRVDVRTLGAAHPCDEHAASISFPGTGLKRFDCIRVLAADFVSEPYHSCLIGRDVLSHWKVTFDGPRGLVIIED